MTSTIRSLKGTPPDIDTVSVERVYHDWDVHHPLGAGSYVFQRAFLSSIRRAANLPENINTTDNSKETKLLPLIIHCGYQPNNSPHIGTITVFATAFHLARALKASMSGSLEVSVSIDMVDTAPDHRHESEVGQGFQRSLRYTGAFSTFHDDYAELFDCFSKASGVAYRETNQLDLFNHTCTPSVVQAVVSDRARLGPELSPETGKLAVRAACPVYGCGITDKHGLKNTYDNESATIHFECWRHGRHSVKIDEDSRPLEWNTPLRNLIRALVFSSDPTAVHIRVTGADYAGQYQEQLLLRQWPHLASYDGDVDRVKRLPIHVYTPLTVDWAGSKLSKSLYVKRGAYQYMNEQGLDYLLSFRRMKEVGKDPTVVWKEVGKWFEEPKRLFRSYSVEFWHMIFTQAEQSRGVR